jgi:hypothetical protein
MKARPLFTVAAVFNFLVGVPMLFAYPLCAALLQIEGPPTVWYHICAAVVIVFGYSYWCIARDPVRFRPYVMLGAIAKLGFVVAVYGHWLAGDASPRLALLVSTDLVFALLFLRFLATNPVR